MSAIALKGVRKAYGDVEVIRRIDIEIESGEFLVLVGPSGCGKSTLLRMVAGLEEITAGDLVIAGTRVNGLSPADRNIAMVFQDYALYPHMSVADNMSFALKMRGANENEISRRVDHAAEILKITGFLERRPSQLSGGQRQRVAMGRAIVREPAAFLFDEPLSNLDAALRVEMRLEIAKLHHRMKATTLYVTHDQVEAMTLADRIVVMNAGHVEQIGAPLDLYRRPATLFVARFIGSPTMNALPGTLRCSGPQSAIEVLGATVPLDAPLAAAREGQAVTVGIRPEDLALCGPEEAWFAGEIAVAERLGSQTYAYVEIGHTRMLTIECPREADIHAGDRVHVRGDAAKLHLFDADGQRLN